MLHKVKRFYARVLPWEQLPRLMKTYTFVCTCSHTHKHTWYLSRCTSNTQEHTEWLLHSCSFSTFSLFSSPSSSALVLWCLFNTNTQTDVDLEYFLFLFCGG
ncbi:hypothetical protein ILYODFUR_032217 [Ilyodon furcidens]|uniref:Uncharacterized protein n=1 Tax=Ilyodon furcidens TaxID=33524 RepID=A0ABV0UZS7_9TELE